MKITSISVKDFRSYEQAEIAFSQPLTIIRAPNGSGKTSLQQAVELSLTSRTDGTDPRGAGANAKIRNGAKKAFIEVLLETAKGSIELKTTYGPGKTGRQQSISDPNFDQYLEKNKERLSCVLNTRYFTSLKPKEQSDVLAGLVLPTSYEFDSKMQWMAENRLGAFDWSKRRPVAVIDQVYETAYNARKTAKATLAAIYIPQQPAKPEYSSERVQKELADLRKKAAAETKTLKGGGNAAVGRLESELERANQSLSALKAKREEASQRYAEIQLLDPATLKKAQKAAAGRRLFNELQAKMVELNNEIHAQRNAQDIYRDLLAEPFCPTCSQAITREFVAGKIAEHVALENEAIEAQRNLLKEQQALGDIARAEKDLVEQASLSADKDRYRLECAQIETRISEANSAVRKLEEDLRLAISSATEPPDTSALDALNEQIAQWEARLGPATTYESTLAAIERETKRYEEQKQVVADLETLCTYFGKDGIKAKLISEHIEAFAATVNSVLSTWGFAATFSFDPYEFLVTGEHGQLPLEELSGGETFMFCAALQCAIAIHGKIKTVVIDEADTLVDAARNRLFKCVKGLLDAGHLDQAIILEASGLTEAPQKPGVAYYRVVDGKVVAL
jgi:DNA repair exonuclease SbcCD ATPase subunit